MPKQKTIPPFSLRLDPSLRERVEAEATKQGRSISNYIQTTLDTHTPPLKSRPKR